VLNWRGGLAWRLAVVRDANTERVAFRGARWFALRERERPTHSGHGVRSPLLRGTLPTAGHTPPNVGHKYHDHARCTATQKHQEMNPFRYRVHVHHFTGTIRPASFAQSSRHKHLSPLPRLQLQRCRVVVRQTGRPLLLCSVYIS